MRAPAFSPPPPPPPTYLFSLSSFCPMLSTGS
ncbi:unnamed protein product [Spirodela intermedia]|uniref:Uncharacterized protein n=1 Tax=Spirodela intermedia TaxID=51605 RepID=A0ABN7EBL1_SPIIN|nr:unnamed protein product [Spirodela intermedia]